MKDKWASLLVDKIEYKKCKNDLAYFYNTYLKIDEEPSISNQEINYHKNRGTKLTELTMVHRMAYWQNCYDTLIEITKKRMNEELGIPRYKL